MNLVQLFLRSVIANGVERALDLESEPGFLLYLFFPQVFIEHLGGNLGSLLLLP